jgi:hypothetical protein
MAMTKPEKKFILGGVIASSSLFIFLIVMAIINLIGH